MLPVHNFTYGILNPALAYGVSCLGAFLGLRCTARATALDGAARVRWLLLGAVSIGTTGIWTMHFIAMLGFTIPGQTLHYNVPVTILSMVIAATVTGIGLLIVGLRPPTWGTLLAAGVFTGLGVASMHYTGMAAVRMPFRQSYSPELFTLSVVIAIVAATAALWAALRLKGTATTLGASLIMGVAVCGMHYTGMFAMRVAPARTGDGFLLTGGGATAVNFLLPLVIGISVVAFVLTATLALSPTDTEIRAEQELLQRIEQASAALAPQQAVPDNYGAGPSQVVSRGTQARRQAGSGQPVPAFGGPRGHNSDRAGR